MTLADYLIEKRLSGAEFARLTGISKAAVSRILRGLDKPSWASIRVIEQVTRGKVKAADFGSIT